MQNAPQFRMAIRITFVVMKCDFLNILGTLLTPPDIEPAHCWSALD